jgi:hypothetical protein
MKLHATLLVTRILRILRFLENFCTPESLLSGIAKLTAELGEEDQNCREIRLYQPGLSRLFFPVIAAVGVEVSTSAATRGEQVNGGEFLRQSCFACALSH